MAVNGLIALYMTMVFVAVLYYEYNVSKHGYLIPFELSNCVYLAQWMYHVIAFVSDPFPCQGFVVFSSIREEHKGYLASGTRMNLLTLLHQIWTLMHLYYPRHSNADTTPPSIMREALSPPRHNQNTRNGIFFSIFYTAIIIFPWVVTFIHWTIIAPRKVSNRTLSVVFSPVWEWNCLHLLPL
jgi:hypothetical protein